MARSDFFSRSFYTENSDEHWDKPTALDHGTLQASDIYATAPPYNLPYSDAANLSEPNLLAHTPVTQSIANEDNDDVIFGEDEWCQHVLGASAPHGASLDKGVGNRVNPFPADIERTTPRNKTIDTASPRKYVFERGTSIHDSVCYASTNLPTKTTASSEAPSEQPSCIVETLSAQTLQLATKHCSLPSSRHNGTPLLTSPLRNTTPSSSSSWHNYLWELCNCGRDTATIRGKQSRLTMWEVLEHFGFLNDLLFIFRVGSITQQPRFQDNIRLQRIGNISILYLTCIWLNSAIAYASRRYIVYHRITPSNSSIFLPIAVFFKIRELGETSPETLYMFERLSWTYQLIMRVVDDIPQLIFSAVFLANFGKSLYTYFMVAYSCMLMVITSIRMGMSYPLFGTLSLILSRSPPVDSPILNEAAPTTRNLALFIAANLTLWSITNGLCLCFVRGLSLVVFSSLMVASALMALLLTFYWLYLHTQAPGLDSIDSSALLQSDTESGLAIELIQTPSTLPG